MQNYIFHFSGHVIQQANETIDPLNVTIQIHKIDEMSLSANQGREEMERKRLVWKVEGSHDEPKVLRGGPVDPQKLVVELAPMEIRTFVIKFGSQGSTASW